MAQPADGGSEHAAPQMATRDLRASSWSGWTGFKTDEVLDRQLTRSAADRAQQHHDEAADREHLREPEPERPFQQHESIVCDVAPQRRKTLARIAAHRRELGVHVAPQRRKPFPHFAPHGGELGPHFSTQIADLALQILTHDTLRNCPARRRHTPISFPTSTTTMPSSRRYVNSRRRYLHTTLFQLGPRDSLAMHFVGAVGQAQRS